MPLEPGRTMSRFKKIKKGTTKGINKESVPSLQVLSREDYLTAIILSTLTLVVYAYTAAPGVTMKDSADFIMGVLTLGIVHPPGYPLYTLLGHLFSFLPFGDPAYRVNLFSALWGSLCLGVVFVILRMLSIRRIHAVFATLFLGFTSVFWSQTGVAEVYSFNGFLIASILFWILSYNRDKKKSQLYLIFLTTGLALSNHYPLVILTGVGLVFLVDRRDLRAIDLAKGLLFLVLGLTPYLYLFIQAADPELQYSYGKVSDFAMVIDHILRKSHRNIYGGTVWDKFILAFTFLKAITTNFLFASVFAFIGMGICFLHKWKYRFPLLIAALSPSLGLILILTFRSEDLFRTNLLDFLIPSFLFISIFLAIGLMELMNRYVKKTIVQASLLLILLLSQAGFNFQSSSHHNDRLAEIWGTQILNSLKPDSILILCPGQFHIYYLRLIKGLRPDVSFYDRSSSYTRENLYQPWLLFRYKRNDANEIRKRREAELINSSQRPIYYTCKEVLDEQKINYTLTPFIFRADRRHDAGSDSSRFKVSDRLLDSIVNGYPKSDYWLDLRRKKIFSRLISYYGGRNYSEANRILEYLTMSKVYSDPQILLSIANNLYYFRNYEMARRLYGRAEELSLGDFSRTDLAVFCDTLARTRNYDRALQICIQGEHASAPCEVNTVKTQHTIAGIYKEQGNWGKVAEYSNKIIQCQPGNEIAQRYLKMAAEGIR
jgi:hypothetical protein